MAIHTKRIYEKSARNDGYRVLVDRLWPRGIKKEDADLDEWKKELAPSTELRKRFGHDKGNWEDFKAKYAMELDDNGESVEELLSKAEEKTITLLYAAKDTERNNAVALKEYLENRRGR